MVKGNSSNEDLEKVQGFQDEDKLTETKPGEPPSERKGQRGRVGDFRIEQLDIGDVENAIYREKWWQIW
jgi:hypothetical protein